MCRHAYFRYISSFLVEHYIGSGVGASGDLSGGGVGANKKTCTQYVTHAECTWTSKNVKKKKENTFHVF